MANVKKCSHENPTARRTGARLFYPTQTGGHQVCITRKGDPALRLLTNRGPETRLFASFGLPTKASSWTVVGQITRKYRTWQALGILSIQAQDATQQRGAATTRREASLGAKGVANYTTGTRTSKHQDSNPQALTQPTRRHKRCKTDGREHGYNAHHPHPRRAQSADTTGPYDPYSTTYSSALTWPGRNSTGKFQAPNQACTRPSLRGRTQASPLGPRT